MIPQPSYAAESTSHDPFVNIFVRKFSFYIHFTLFAPKTT